MIPPLNALREETPMKRRAFGSLAVALIVLASVAASPQRKPVPPAVDPVVQKIIQLGTTDNQVMVWSDTTSNRFGGRESGSNAYNDASAWAVWQFKQWGSRPSSTRPARSRLASTAAPGSAR
jgi:hypothetical protein